VYITVTLPWPPIVTVNHPDCNNQVLRFLCTKQDHLWTLKRSCAVDIVECPFQFRVLNASCWLGDGPAIQSAAVGDCYDWTGFCICTNERLLTLIRPSKQPALLCKINGEFFRGGDTNCAPECVANVSKAPLREREL
jgi:hypothetical protein